MVVLPLPIPPVNPTFIINKNIVQPLLEINYRKNKSQIPIDKRTTGIWDLKVMNYFFSTVPAGLFKAAVQSILIADFSILI